MADLTNSPPLETTMQTNEHSCCVCGKTSTGIHYGVRSCEGCKAFYKRSVLRHAKYNCYFGGNCFVAKSRFVVRCRSCRLKRCSEAGMHFSGNKRKRRKSTQNSPGQNELFNKKLSNSESSLLVEDLILPSQSHIYSQIEEEYVTPTLGVIRYSSSQNSNKNLNGNYNVSHQESLQQVFSGVRGRLFSTVIRERFRMFGEKCFHMAAHNAKLRAELHFSLNRPVLDAHIAGLAGSMHEHNVEKFPTFLANYWSNVSEKSKTLLETARAVDAAVDEAYGDQLKKWHRFMERAFLYDEIPYQPQTSLEGMMETFRCNITDIGKRLSNFALLLPGFTELSPATQQFVLKHRWSGCWLVHQAFFVRKGVYYHLIGPHDFHYSRYWLDLLLEPAFVAYCINVMEEFNQLKLNMTETYLLMAVYLTNIEPNDLFEDGETSHLLLLHSFYSDTLCSLIRSQRSLTASAGVLENMHSVMARLKSFRKVDELYLSALDMSKLPFRPVRGSMVLSATEFFASLN